MHGKAYLGMGGTSMGIADSAVDHAFFETLPGMRVESVDMTGFVCGIDDEAESAKALPWVKKNCPEGQDDNAPKSARSREELDGEWKTCVKVSLSRRDPMVGNPRLAEAELGEEANSPFALASQLRIPVHMHNVAGERVFRPAARNAFGTASPEFADVRTCANFGPLYGYI